MTKPEKLLFVVVKQFVCNFDLVPYERVEKYQVWVEIGYQVIYVVLDYQFVNGSFARILGVFSLDV